MKISYYLTLFTFLLSLWSNQAFSADAPPFRYSTFQGCGSYLVGGYLKKEQEKWQLVLWPKTQAEVTFDLPASAQKKVEEFADLSVEVKATILEKMDGTKGMIAEINTIEYRVPNPLYAFNDSGFIFQGKKKCQK